ncbi:uncharacterized protein LOC135126846 [Zophobas morio]|uniref:uncharacterized protein LOC135126846 n=1 Tax=Zophobas morio TaxID=2755281 RepID=UPI003083427A
MLPKKLITSSLWWHGPLWLCQNKAAWPKVTTSQNQETNKLDHVMTEKRAENKILNVSPKNTLTVLTKFSSLDKLQRIIAYCKRIVHNCLNLNNKMQGLLSLSELDQANDAIIKMVQASEFYKEISDLENKREISKSSKLRILMPFLDKNGIIPVGGRLTNSRIPSEQRFPKLLPAKHHVTKLIILKIHQDQLHAGPCATLAALREKYWPLAAQSTIRYLLQKCYVCFKVDPQSNDQLMGDLPAERVQPSRPFSDCDVDYAGPIIIKEGGPRSKKTVKAYIALFKCFATKAVHIELVGNLTCESFINALKRFVGRRGKVSQIFSDNATYFTAANHELKNLLNSSDFQQGIDSFLRKDGIKWHFIPARSPHRRRFWEAGIKAVKYHVKRVVGNALLSYEELLTVLTQIEACVNSRPLTPLSHDPVDISPLTPGNFLIGDTLATTAEADLTTTNENRLSRWQRVQQITQNFWKRWSKEFLNTLQQRSKWRERCTNQAKPGLPVLLKEENLHPLCWKMGVIKEVDPGKDELSTAFARSHQRKKTLNHTVIQGGLDVRYGPDSDQPGKPGPALG